MKSMIPRFIHDNYQAGNFSGHFEAAAMFVDISGFTQTTEALMRLGREEGAEVLSEILRTIFTPTVRAVYEHGGFIVGFAGDAFTALFPIETIEAKPCEGFQTSPLQLTPETFARFALAAALDIRQFFSDHPTIPSKFGDFPFGVKIGLAVGPVEWGIVGSKQRKTFYFRGPAIDDCARAEHHAQKGELWATTDFVAPVADLIPQKFAEDDCYRIDRIKPDRSSRPVRFESAPAFPLDLAIHRIFCGAALAQLPHAEFRKIVPVFIAFEGISDLNHFAENVLTLMETYGGELSRIDFGDKGGNVLVFFGAPVAYEDNEARALRFVHRLKTLTEASEIGARLRAGVTVGVSYCGLNGSDLRAEFTCLGNAVNLSARLMMAAEWGHIFVVEEIAQQPQFMFAYAGERQYKGRAQTVPTYAYEGPTPVTEKFFSGQFIGRQSELAQLTTWAKPVFDGRFAGIACIYGEPGQGKSRLLDELLNALKREQPILWLEGQVDQIVSRPFDPFIYILRQRFSQQDSNSPAIRRVRFEASFKTLLDALAQCYAECPSDSPAAGRVDQLRRELARTQSVLGALLGLHWPDSLYEQLDAKGRYQNTLQALKTWLLAESLLQPVALVIEDFHWLDEDSREALRGLTRQIADFSLAILGTARYRDDGGKPAFVPETSPEVPRLEIDLNQLSADSVAKLAEAELDGLIDPALLQILLDRAYGNPFFTQQLLRHLSENNLLQSAKDNEGRRIFLPPAQADVMPDSISAVFVARIDRLERDLQEMIKTAAVFGREFNIGDLLAVLQRLNSPLEKGARGMSLQEEQPTVELKFPQQLQAVERERIWAALDEGRRLFNHALLRDAAYKMQLKARLRQLHQTAAECIEQATGASPEHYAVLAYHYEQAGLIGKTIVYLQKAGDFAKGKFENHNALALYDRLLNLILPHARAEKVSASIPVTIDAMINKAHVLDLIGKWQDALQVLQAALNLAENAQDIIRIGAVCKTTCALFMQRGQYDEAFTYCERYYIIAQQTSNTLGLAEALGMIGIIHITKGEHKEALNCLEQEWQICERLNDKKGMARAIGNIGIVYDEQGDRLKALSCYQKRLQLAEEINHKSTIANAACNLGVIFYFDGNYEKAMRFYQQSLQACSELGHQRQLSISIGNIGAVYEEKGEFEKARQCYEKKMVICKELGDKRELTMAWCGLGNICKAKGEYLQANDYYERAIELAEQLGAKYYLVEFVVNKAEASYLNRDDTTALFFAERGLTMAEETGRRDFAFKARLLQTKISLRANPLLDAARLELLQPFAENEAEQALWHFECWRAFNHNEHRQQATELYQKLYGKIPKHDYYTHLTELSAL